MEKAAQRAVFGLATRGPTRRCSQPEPAGWAWGKSNVIGGWLRWLTFALSGSAVDDFGHSMARCGDRNVRRSICTSGPADADFPTPTTLAVACATGYVRFMDGPGALHDGNLLSLWD